MISPVNRPTLTALTVSALWASALSALADGYVSLWVGRGTGYGEEVRHQPCSPVEVPTLKRGENREHRFRQTPAPLRSGTIVVFASHGRATQQAFATVVVHGDACIVNETKQALPMVPQTFQRLATWQAKFSVAQFFGELSFHLLDRRAKLLVCHVELG